MIVFTSTSTIAIVTVTGVSDLKLVDVRQLTDRPFPGISYLDACLSALFCSSTTYKAADQTTEASSQVFQWDVISV